jgi:hypothetical protein
VPSSSPTADNPRLLKEVRPPAHCRQNDRNEPKMKDIQSKHKNAPFVPISHALLEHCVPSVSRTTDNTRLLKETRPPTATQLTVSAHRCR